MKLPEGKKFGSMKAPLEEVLPFTDAFCAVVWIQSEGVEGFVLSEEGRPIAAWYNGGSEEIVGQEALELMFAEPAPSCILGRYDPDEFEEAVGRCRSMGYLISEHATPVPVDEGVDGDVGVPALNEGSLNLILSQPGVIAVSAFYEGFAVQSAGAADFDRIAAVAEDLLRAGSRIACDMETGDLDQIILETPGGKLIIAPFGDLSLCVLAESNANLGLIRVALRSIRWDG
ncbi:roadblock/LC7 domain-containing protein [Methanofollis fontis]|uniref:Dynein regulation protein LC7 n=1 Tax=Methanofollis fontis TaxID=2052832 RepID=A0A483CQ82_9EURY|nr:roadblock/LC7 domain-containing protein [Methanofollis fontis]TAJ44845.1 dynein regulation protein LC7 [Methanofollis fontis]